MRANAEYEWAAAQFNDGELVFTTPDGFSQALHDGFFFVDIPSAFDLSAGDLFATSFYQPCAGTTFNAYRNFKVWTSDRLAEHEGYFLRDVDQVEQFFLESRFWPKVFPSELVLQAQGMRDFANDILRTLLSRLDIPTELWDEATGHCLSGRGTYHLTFNHFRPTVRARGWNVHKDSGWITVLRSLEPGLEVLRGAEWLPITPRVGAFIVNFGCAMEILTRNSRTPVAAVAHRVVEQRPDDRTGPDRFSYALFLDSDINADLYRYDFSRGLVLEVNFKEFLDDILRNTYRHDSEGLY